MLITTFRIDGIKEVSMTTPLGIQEDGGVYGFDSRYSTWILGENGDTTDFVNVSKNVILYGDLYKITLDTGPAYNSLVQFMNMNFDEYWALVSEGRFKFNNLDYQQYILTRPKLQNNQLNYATLLEYANASKQRIGWVEINRTRSSIYYESCENGLGRLARSDQFYDVDSFIMSKNLFEPINVDPRNLNASTIGTFIYQTNEQDFISDVIPSSQAGSKIGIQPIGKIEDSLIQNFYFDTLPYPNGFQGNRNANDYLRKLFLGVHPTLDATIQDGPIQKFTPPPIQKNAILNNIPLLYATGKENSIGGQELVSEDQNGQPISIWSGYSKSIWGQYRIIDYSTNPPTFEKIEIGFRPNVDSSSKGLCMRWGDGKKRGDGGKPNRRDRKVGTRKRSKTESDPFDLNDFKLDMPYEDFYEKIPCPKKKKLKGKDCVSVNNTNYLINEIKDLLQTEGVRVIPIGAFNPDLEISIMGQSIRKNNFKVVDTDTEFGKLTLPTSVIYNGPVNKKVQEKLYEQVNNDQNKLTPSITRLYGRSNRIHHEGMEISNDIRESNSILSTSVIFPYGTIKVKSELKNGVTELKIQQVGAECVDKNEFYKSVNFLKSVSRKSDGQLKPIGVDIYGYPVFNNIDKMKGVIDSLLRDLFGFAEITVDGNQIVPGWYTTYGDFWTGLTSTDVLPIQIQQESSYKLRQAIVTPLYVEEEKTIGGEDIDVNKDKIWEPAQDGTLNSIVNVNVGPVTSYWTKDVIKSEPGSNQPDYVSEPYLTTNNNSIYKRYDLNDDAEWGAFLADSKTGFKRILLDPNIRWSSSEKSSLKTLLLKIDELSSGGGRSSIINLGKPYKYKNTKRYAFTYKSSSGLDVAVIPPTIYEYDYNNNCHKTDFDTKQKPGYSAFYQRCDKKSSEEPVVSSDYPVISGWVLEGLYHRDIKWGNRYGLIMDRKAGWTEKEAQSCQCGELENGGWKKVNPERIRLEKHYYNDRDLYWYNKVGQSGGPEGYAVDLIDELKETVSRSTGKKLYDENQILYLTLAHRSLHEFYVENLNGGNITIFLRPNIADSRRGLKDLDEQLSERQINWSGLSSGTLDVIPKGHFVEERYQSMGTSYNFATRFDPEPTYHTIGQFDPTQTYRAVFRKYVSGRSSDDAVKDGSKIISTGISDTNSYKPTTFNKKVACEMLYVVETIYKMHRARLKQINDLMKNQIDAYGVTYADSPNESVDTRFDYYLSKIKELHQVYKQKLL